MYEKCALGFFSLGSQTLIQPSSELRFDVILGRVEKRMLILSAGSLKIAVVKGEIKGSCHGISIGFAGFFEEDKLFTITLDIFVTYISMKLSDENGSRTRKLPCVVSPDSDRFIIGAENAANKGCIKKL